MDEGRRDEGRGKEKNVRKLNENRKVWVWIKRRKGWGLEGKK